MKSIPQRELRNRISQVLRRVEAGERLRVTVNGRPVADLVPVGEARQTYAPRDEVTRLLQHAPLDPAFISDIHAATSATIEEL